MPRTTDDVRREIEREREQLASAVDDLREAADMTSKLRAKLPAVAAGGAATGFVLAGGIGATMRLLARRGREGVTKSRWVAFGLATAADRASDADVGHVPSGPHRLSAREWLAALKRTAKQFLADDCMGLSQQVAFSSLLAFFPSVILLVGLLGLFGAYEDLKTFLGTVAPGAVIDAIDLAQETAAGNKATSTVAVVIGFFGAIWAASGAMTSVIKALNVAHDRIETRGFLKVRFYSIVLVFAIGVTFAGLFVLIVFGGPLGDAIAGHAHLGGAWDLTGTSCAGRSRSAACCSSSRSSTTSVPNVDQRSWKWITPGSLVGAVLWLALSGLFSLYTSFSSSYDQTYGSLAGGIILLLWLNYSAMALLFGAELNAELDRQADIHASGGPRAGLIGYARRNR